MTRTVLIVEDDDLNLRLCEDVLAAQGYATLATSDGAEAVEIARAQRPDLILMDVELGAQSGLEATQKMKRDEALADIPVIAVTAHARRGDEDRILASGCDGYIAKPYELDMLISAVERGLP